MKKQNETTCPHCARVYLVTLWACPRCASLGVFVREGHSTGSRGSKRWVYYYSDGTSETLTVRGRGV